MSADATTGSAPIGTHRGAVRTVIVGGGTAGCVLAARLSEDPQRLVTLVEAGPAGETPAELRDGGSIPAAMPGHPASWSYEVDLAPGRPFTVVRGRILGGSSTINGGYFVRAPRSDFEQWAKAGGPAWSYESVLPLLIELENDLDLGEPGGHDSPGSPKRNNAVHGTAGPVGVQRPPLTSALARAFVAAAKELGFPEEHDKNAADHPPGIGPVPSNIIGGVRVNTAQAYLSGTPAQRENLRVLGGTRALRVRIENGRAVGVETDAGYIAADEVVLSAGAIATAQLLMLSGIGPAEHLAEFDIPLVADLPVGERFSDHPNMPVGWLPKRPLHDDAERFAFPAALNFDSALGNAASADDAEPSAAHPDGDLEVLLVSKPLAALFAEAAGAGTAAGSGAAGSATRSAPAELQLLVALQAPAGRGRLSLRSGDPLAEPRIEYGHLTHPEDLRCMRVGIRTAARLLRSRAFAPLFDGFASLDDETLADDERLDAWIRASLGTALHLSGTAPMGEVVDGDGRVHGVAGLRVADTSLLPTVPSRGPFNTAVLIGELIARRILADRTRSQARSAHR